MLPCSPSCIKYPAFTSDNAHHRNKYKHQNEGKSKFWCLLCLFRNCDNKLQSYEAEAFANVLYQSGYHTIKGYDLELNVCRLNFPNTSFISTCSFSASTTHTWIRRLVRYALLCTLYTPVAYRPAFGVEVDSHFYYWETCECEL